MAFENRLLREIFGPKRGGVKESGGNSIMRPSTVRANKYVMSRWAGHTAREEREEVYLGFWWGHLNEKDQFEDLAVDRGIILKWILKN